MPRNLCIYLHWLQEKRIFRRELKKKGGRVRRNYRACALAGGDADERVTEWIEERTKQYYIYDQKEDIVFFVMV
jgi:hypothetical protein